MELEPAIQKAEERIEYLSSDQETLNIYYERERALHERVNMINSAEQRGRAVGLEEGREEGSLNQRIEFVKEMLKENESIKKIIKYSKFT